MCLERYLALFLCTDSGDIRFKSTLIRRLCSTRFPWPFYDRTYVYVLFVIRFEMFIGSYNIIHILLRTTFCVSRQTVTSRICQRFARTHIIILTSYIITHSSSDNIRTSIIRKNSINRTKRLAPYAIKRKYMTNFGPLDNHSKCLWVWDTLQFDFFVSQNLNNSNFSQRFKRDINLL